MKLTLRDSGELLRVDEIVDLLPGDAVERQEAFAWMRGAIVRGEVPLRRERGFTVPVADLQREAERSAQCLLDILARVGVKDSLNQFIKVEEWGGGMRELSEAEVRELDAPPWLMVAGRDQMFVDMTDPAQRQALVRETLVAREFEERLRDAHVSRSDLVAWMSTQGFASSSEDEVAVGGQSRSKPGPKPGQAQGRLREIVEALVDYASATKRPFDPKAAPGPLGEGWQDEGSLHWFCAKLDRRFKNPKATFENQRAGILAVRFYATRTDFYRDALPHIAPKFKR